MKAFKHALLCSFAFLLLAGGKADAITVNWSAAADNGFADAFGVKLLPGSLLLLGSFNISDSIIQQNAGNTSFLMSHFTTFGTSSIGTNVGLPGYFADSTTANGSTTTPFPVNGQPIYIWAFNTPSVTTATQQGIFSQTAASNWIFPNQISDPVGTTSIDLTDLTNAAGTSLIAGADIVVGGFQQGVGNTLDFDLALIPEPSTYVLAALGGVILLFVRRKHCGFRAVETSMDLSRRTFGKKVSS